MEERLKELELRYMHQERTLQELNEVVSRQALVIELLSREMNELKELSLQVPSPLLKDTDQEKPPHY